MAQQSVGPASSTMGSPTMVAHTSCLPMAIILLAEMQMAFNVNALPVSIGAIVTDLDVSATAIGSALVVYSLFVAAFVMVGAKIGKLVGERRVFQATVLMHGAAMGMMAFSANAAMMNTAQMLAGASPVAGVLAFLVAGFI